MAKVKRILLLFIIILTPSIIREIFFPEDDYLGGGYTFDSKAIWGEKPEQIDIPNEVIQYNYNKKYIIAKQRYLHAVDTTWFNIGNRNRAYGEYDSIYYWIIDKQKDTVYGPMDSITFIRISKRFECLPVLNSDNE